MKIAQHDLLSSSNRCLYLFGEDRDALNEHAYLLLAGGETSAVRLRLDVSELHRIEEEQRNQSLFGASICYALVRNAESATPKQGEYLLQLAQATVSPHRLIICAGEISWKKAMHKSMQAIADVGCCEFSSPSLQAFHQWLKKEATDAGLRLHEEGLQQVAEQLCGMRLAARQWLARLKLYQGDSHHPISLAVMHALLGEHAPDDLDDWVHAVAMREPAALRLTLHLLHDQQVSEVQMHAWLSTRMQQILMYRWYHAQRHTQALRAAKVFGDAVRRVPQASQRWQVSELMEAVNALQKSEMVLKGASVESKAVVLERLVAGFLMPHDTAFA